MNKEDRIYVTDSDSFFGEPLVRLLTERGFNNIVGLGSSGPDLGNSDAVSDFFTETKPDYVFLTAGKTAGIMGNKKFPASLMLDNLLSTCHVIESAYQTKAKKLLYLASSCTYPKHCPQPMKIEHLMTGTLEPTNEAYATAKLAG
ncbi:MAG: NAD-dependent epimerase/dehydratase family protein, partial [Thermodesulfobacteriota bacterium]